MKKILKKEVIIAFIIGIILASSIAVYAATINAKDVDYKDGKTVEYALNELYNKKDLLWTNPNSSIEFANQKLNLNLNNYTAIIIMGKYSATNDTTKTYSYIEVGKDGVLKIYHSSGVDATYRNISVSTDGVEISAGLNTAQATTNINNMRAIPTYIFGVK